MTWWHHLKLCKLSVWGAGWTDEDNRQGELKRGGGNFTLLCSSSLKTPNQKRPPVYFQQKKNQIQIQAGGTVRNGCGLREWGQCSNYLRHCCSVLMHSSKGDWLSEIMEQKCWKESTQVQSDTLILRLDQYDEPKEGRCLVSKLL